MSSNYHRIVIALLAITILLFLAGLSGCESVTAQTPPPHKIVWDHDGQNVSGFMIYCGQSSAVYTQNYNLPDPNARELVLTLLNLPDGVNYCAMTAYNFVGESSYSAEVSGTFMGGDLILSAPNAPSTVRLQ